MLFLQPPGLTPFLKFGFGQICHFNNQTYQTSPEFFQVKGKQEKWQALIFLITIWSLRILRSSHAGTRRWKRGLTALSCWSTARRRSPQSTSAASWWQVLTRGTLFPNQLRHQLKLRWRRVRRGGRWARRSCSLLPGAPGERKGLAHEQAHASARRCYATLTCEWGVPMWSAMWVFFNFQAWGAWDFAWNEAEPASEPLSGKWGKGGAVPCRCWHSCGWGFKSPLCAKAQMPLLLVQ